MFMGALVIIGWNEKTFVCGHRRFIYASRHARAADCSGVLKDGKPAEPGDFLLFACELDKSSLATLDFDLKEREGPFGLPPSVHVRRAVEIYQCTETCFLPHEHACVYRPAWVTRKADTVKFRDPHGAASASGCGAAWNGTGPHEALLSARGERRIGNGVAKAGQFYLGAPLLDHFAANTVERWRLPQAGAEWYFENVSAKFIPTRPAFNATYIVDASCKDDNLHIGCIRLRYTANTDSGITAFAAVAERTDSGELKLAPQLIPAGSWDCEELDWWAGRPGILGKPGAPDRASAVARLHKENSTSTWVFRSAGLILAWLVIVATFLGAGLSCCSRGEHRQDCLGHVMTMVLGTISCSIGCSCGLMLVAIVMIGCSPALGTVALGAALVLLGIASALIVRYASQERMRASRDALLTQAP